MKKFLSLVLTALMVFSMLPMSIFAEEGDSFMDLQDYINGLGDGEEGEFTFTDNASAVSVSDLDALLAALDDASVTDIIVTDTIHIPAGAVVTIDLAGKNVYQEKEQTEGYQMILNDGTLTIEDSEGDGVLRYTDTGNGGEYISDVIYNRGTLIINGGTIENLSSATVASNGYPHAVDTYSGIRDTSVTINGGTIRCASYSAVRMFCVSATNEADLVITGGTVQGAIDMQNGTHAAALGSLTITGGTFETTANVNNIRFANWNGGATEYGIEASIAGGSFDGSISTAYVPAAADFDAQIITGGTFSEDVSAYVADGYALGENGAVAPAVTNVAEINGVGYETLQAALEAAQAGDTVTINEAGEYSLVCGTASEGRYYLPANLTIKGAVDGITVTNSPKISAESITIDNVDFVSTTGNALTFYTSGDSAFKNCNIQGPNGTFYSCASGTLLVENCTVIGTNTYGLQIAEGTCDVTVKDSVIGGWNTYGTGMTTVFENTTFVDDYPYAFVGFYSGTTFENCKFEENVLVASQSSGVTIELNGCAVVDDDGNAVDGKTVYSIIDADSAATNTIKIDGVIVTEDQAEGGYVADVNGVYYATFEEAVANIATDGSDTTIKLLCDVEVGKSIEFNYGAGDVIFTADTPVTVKQTAEIDFAFVKGGDNKIIVGENVTFDVYSNASGMYVYYGSGLEVNGAVTGGDNWGCLYLYQGDHTVSETGKIGVGRVQLRGGATLNLQGAMDTNYLLVEAADFTADGAVVDANVIYDNNNGGQRDGASTFDIKNGSEVTTSKLTLSYADSVLTIDMSSKLTASTIVGAGKIVIDAANYTEGDACPIVGNATGFAGTIEVVNADGIAADVDEDGNIVFVEVSVPVAQVGETKYESVLAALKAAIDAGAPEVKLLADSREVMPSDFDINISADLTITADAPVKAEFYNEGTKRDFAIGSTNNNKLTIGENVHFDLVDRVIWIGFWGDNVDVIVEGYLGGYQIWHGADTTVSETGTLDSHGEAFIMRRDATLTVDGGKVNANYITTYSGHIVAKDATITAGLVWIYNDHSYGVEGTVSMELDNTAFTSNGVVTVKAGEGKEVPISLTNGTVFAAKGALTTGDRVSVTADTSSSFTAKNASVFVATAGNMQYTSLQDAINNAAGDTVVLVADAIGDVTVAEDANIVLNLNGFDIVGTMFGITNNGTLTINDTVGTGNVYTTDVSAQGRSTIVNNGMLTINGGWFGDSNNDTTDRNAINRGPALRNSGTAVINGGYFTDISNQLIDGAYAYALITNAGATTTVNNATVYGDINGLVYSTGKTVVNDGSFTLGRPNEENNLWYLAYGDVEIKGGTWTRAFKVPSWNAGDPKFEGAVAVSGGTFNVSVPDAYCAEGLTPVVNGDGTYTVGVLPSAKVTSLGVLTLDTYRIYEGNWPPVDGTEPITLQVAMQFEAKDTSAQAAASAFADYITDFYITLDGMSQESFIANGCYLAGAYGEYGWILIPLDGVEIVNGQAYPVISNMFEFSYETICTSVGTFNCGIYFSDEVLAANPDMNVTLELGLSEDIDAAKAADFITVDEPYVFDAEDFVIDYVAEVNGVKYTTLADAFAAAQSGDTVTLLADAAMAEEFVVNNMVLTIDGSATLTLNDKLVVRGESTLNVSAALSGEVILGHGAIVKDSTINGPVFVAGSVTFRGDNTVAMLYDFGTLTDNYGTEAPMAWTVEAGASLTLTDKARYGLGYGDVVTVYGNLTDALTARDALTDADVSLFMHGLVAQESKGWNCNSSFVAKNAYLVIGSNNSFGNKPGNYAGTYVFEIENVVLDGSRITFYEALSKTTFTMKSSDVKIGTFMTNDADSSFILENTKLVSTATTNGTDESNKNAGALVLKNSSLTYNAAFTNIGAITMDVNSSLIAPKVLGAGTITVDAADFDGTTAQVVTADMSGFTGTVAVINNASALYEITDSGIVIYAKPVSGKISYRAYVGDSASREAVQVDLENLCATESVVVKLYDANGNLLTTTSLKAGGVTAEEYTVNIVLWGNPSGSWDTTIETTLTADNMPETIELWVDGQLMDTFANALGAGTNVDETAKYLALDCLVQPVAQIGGVKYTTIAAAVAAAQAGDVVTVIADVSGEAVTVDKNLTVTGAVTLTDVSITGATGVELTVSGLTFAGNSWINSNGAAKLTVSGVTANVQPSNGSATNSRSAFVALGSSEWAELVLVIENSNIVVKGGGDPVLGWAAITEATLSGNTFGASNAYQTTSDSVKFMSIADGAVFNVTNNTVYSNYNGIVFGQNTTRDNAYTVNLSGNTFYGSADHIWVEVSGSNTCHATIVADSTNTVNGNVFTAADIKLKSSLNTFTGYMGVGVDTDAEGKLVGGTYVKAPAADLIADGYECVDNGNGTYGVVEAETVLDGLTGYYKAYNGTPIVYVEDVQAPMYRTAILADATVEALLANGGVNKSKYGFEITVEGGETRTVYGKIGTYAIVEGSAIYPAEGYYGNFGAIVAFDVDDVLAGKVVTYKPFIETIADGSRAYGATCEIDLGDIKTATIVDTMKNFNRNEFTVGEGTVTGLTNDYRAYKGSAITTYDSEASVYRVALLSSVTADALVANGGVNKLRYGFAVTVDGEATKLIYAPIGTYAILEGSRVDPAEGHFANFGAIVAFNADDMTAQKTVTFQPFLENISSGSFVFGEATTFTLGANN